MKKILKLTSSLVLILLFISCQTRNDYLGNEFGVHGTIQKGPFIQGSEVRIHELSDDLNPTGISYYTETKDDLGSFKLDGEIMQGYYDIATTGFYYNEIEGKLSNSYITLKCLNYLNSNESLNVNVLTTLSYNRIKYLLKEEAYSFFEAKFKAQKEVLKAFHINMDTLDIQFEKLDISKDGVNNAILLAISSILQNNNTEAELSELITKISDDLEMDGILDNDGLKLKIKNNSIALNPEQVKLNLLSRYNQLELWNASVPDFYYYIDSDGDGVINIDQSSDSLIIQALPADFSLMAGTYNTDIKVVLSTATRNASIYYTLNGSVPTRESIKYTTPIEINGNGREMFISTLVATPSSASSLITSSYYKINYSYNDSDYKEFSSLNEVKEAIVGKWVGNGDSPWVGVINVEFHFKSDGHYSARGLTYHFNSIWPALFRGTDEDNDVKIYELRDMSFAGNVTGDIVIYFHENGNTNTDQIKFLRFSRDLSVMTFELWRGNYGPIIYNLTRIQQ